MENSQQIEVLFPSEAELKSYFTDDVWNTIAEYEKITYRNMLHNFNKMKSLGLKPTKPPFMMISQKKSFKRKAENSSFSAPVKKTQVKREVNSEKVSSFSVSAKKIQLKKGNNSGKVEGKTKTESETFSRSHQLMSIRLQCVFTAVFKVYKRYHGIIKSYYLKKSEPLKTSKKYVKSNIKTVKKIKEAEMNIGLKNNNTDCDSNENREKSNKKKNSQMNKSESFQKMCLQNRGESEYFVGNNIKGTQVDNILNTIKSDTLNTLDPKKTEKQVINKIIESGNSVKTVAAGETKPPLPCRSVQTMTVSVGQSISDSALVFVNAATTKKMSSPPPNLPPAMPWQRKQIKKLNREKLKNCRRVQTQTVAENTSVEDAKLVFFPVAKCKSKPSAQPDSADNVLAANENRELYPVLVNSENDEFEFGKPLNKNRVASSECVKAMQVKSAAKSVSTNTEIQSDDPKLVPECSTQLAGRRYPRRSVPVIDYTEAALFKDDEYLFCDLCDREYEGDCPEHGPHKFFPDTFVPITGDKNRAIQTTPPMLKVDKSMIPGAGSGVWTVFGLPAHVRLGPYQGDEVSEPDPLGYSWTIMKDRKVDYYIAAQSTATSNWMRFVNCARHESEQNLMAFQYKGQLYYRTVKPVPPKTELFVWYGKEYAQQLGISLESFRSKTTSHLNNLVFPCESCNTTYSSPLYLETHKKYCRGKKTVLKVDPSSASVPRDVQTLAVVVDGRKTYCCSLCGYRTNWSSWMKYHLVVHTGERPYTCDVCGKGFTQTSNLDRHKQIHTGSKKFKCSECLYSCNQIGSLKLHMRTHTEEKPFSCTKCPYRTTQSSHLATHMRKHTGEKPYSCTKCPYRTTQSSHLATHMRKHTGEKPYSCTKCPYRTTQSSALARHMKTHSTGSSSLPL